MHRGFTFFITTAFLLFACSLFSPLETPLPETMSAPATSMPATQPPNSVPVTQPSVVRPNLPAGWSTQLETISPRNWTRLQLVQAFPAEMPMVHSVVVIEPEGKTLVLGNSNKAQLFFFDLESGTISPKSLDITNVKNINVPFKAIKYLSDGSIIVSSDSPYMIYHIDSAGNILSAWDGIEFAVSADEKNLALEIDEETTLINIANNAPIALLENSNGLDYSFSPDNSKIAIDAVTVDYANVDIWDIKSQTILKTLQNMYMASYSPNGKFLVMIDTVDNTLKIFSPDGAVLITTILDAHSNYLISPDGSIVAYQNAKGSSVARETTNWKSFETALRGRLDSFSPDGRFLITRTDDGGILIWGVLKGKG
jgi:WD40 repeat protein